MDVLSGQMKDVIRQGIEYLAGICDHATSRDNMGFSGNTAPLGHELAHLPDRYWNDGTFIAAARVLHHHRLQAISGGILLDEHISDLEIIANGTTSSVIPSAWVDMDRSTGGLVLSLDKEMRDLYRILRRLPGAKQPAGKGRLWAVNAECAFALNPYLDRFDVQEETVRNIVIRSLRSASEELIALASDRSIKMDAGRFCLNFSYNADIIERIKSLKGRIFDGKQWVITPSHEAGLLLQTLCGREGFNAAEDVHAAIADAIAMPATSAETDTPSVHPRIIRATAIGTRIRLSFRYAQDIVEAMKSIPKECRSFDYVTKSWDIDINAVPDLIELLEALDNPIDAESMNRLREWGDRSSVYSPF